MEITKLEEFRRFIIPLSEASFQMLKKNIIKEGCRDPLVLWKHKGENILVDGHNRHRICEQEGIEFNVVYHDFGNKEEVKKWMIDNQLGRRNLTPNQASFYRGLKYIKTRQKRGGYDKVIQEEKGEPTSELLSREFKVSKATIERDARYAAALEIIGDSNPELRADILLGNVRVKKGEVVLLRDQKGIKIKNEKDLHNKLLQLKSRKPFEKKEDQDSEVENEMLNSMLSSKAERMQSLKGKIISKINAGIETAEKADFAEVIRLVKKLEQVVVVKNGS